MRPSVLAAALCAVLVVPALAVASDLPDVSGYLGALDDGRVGDVEIRAHGEPRRPDSPPVPYPGVSVLAVPYSSAIASRLDELKARQRDSIGRYTSTYAEVTAAIDAYAEQLRAIGGDKLVRRAPSDSDGVARLSGLPAGEWLLLAWREERHEVKNVRTPGSDAGRFTPTPITRAYAAVSYWRAPVSVIPGKAAEVRLTDRSVWLTAVREERVLPGGPPPLQPGGLR